MVEQQIERGFEILRRCPSRRESRAENGLGANIVEARHRFTLERGLIDAERLTKAMAKASARTGFGVWRVLQA